MKKLVLAVAVVAFAATTLTSCKKEYTCTCKVTLLGITTSASGTIKDTKKNAKEECDKGDSAGVSECEID